MYACHIQHNKLQVNTSFLSPNQSVNDVFIFSVMHQVCNQLYSWFSQGKHAQLHSSGRAYFCQKYLGIWGQDCGWSNPFLQFTLFHFTTATPILSLSLHNFHLTRTYYTVSASVGDAKTQKRHCSLPTLEGFTIYKWVEEKHLVLWRKIKLVNIT